jgi:hypothetical protein
MKRRDFLKLPALAAIPIIGIAEVKADAQKHEQDIELSWDDKYMYAHGRPIARVMDPDNEDRQRAKKKLAEWLSKRMDELMFEALTS